MLLLGDAAFDDAAYDDDVGGSNDEGAVMVSSRRNIHAEVTQARDRVRTLYLKKACTWS